LVTEMGGIRLRHELDRIPLWRGQDVGVKQLAEDVARYLYLPRLRDTDVLIRAIEDGLSRLNWREETFAYAEAYDEKLSRSQNLQAGKSVRVLTDGRSLLVRPDVAATQFAAETATVEEKAGIGSGTGTSEKEMGGTKGEAKDKSVVKPPPKLTR